jgi:hypothetical protein
MADQSDVVVGPSPGEQQRIALLSARRIVGEYSSARYSGASAIQAGNVTRAIRMYRVMLRHLKLFA